MNKTQLRSKFKSIRANIPDRQSREKEILKRLFSSEAYLSCKILFLYAGFNSEVSTDEIFYRAISDGKTVAYPVCDDADGKMTFYSVKSKSQLKSGMYGIKEPDKSYTEIITPSEHSLIIVPALCFDLKGNRLGYGKGYYDRYLELYPCKSVGLAFEECVIESLPTEEFDKMIDILITDKNLYKFQNNQGGIKYG